MPSAVYPFFILLPVFVFVLIVFYQVLIDF